MLYLYTRSFEKFIEYTQTRCPTDKQKRCIRLARRFLERSTLKIAAVLGLEEFFMLQDGES